MPPQRRVAESIRGDDVNIIQYYLIKYSFSSLNIDTVFDRFRKECVGVEVVEENHPQDGRCLLCVLQYKDKRRRDTGYFSLNEESTDVIELKGKANIERQRHHIKSN